ncbi:MAG: beta-ketoacyl-[acyl-carrier-protein] synthase family protein [Thermodesulfobacteriota bacterium]
MFRENIRNKDSQKKIAISGMGCISGAGEDVQTNWANLCNGVVRCRTVPEWLFPSTLPYPVFVAPAVCCHPEQRKYFPHLRERPEEQINRTILLIINAAVQALIQAGLAPDNLKGKRVGMIFGTTVGCNFNDENYYSAWLRGLKPDLEPVKRYLTGNIASALQTFSGNRGPTAVITNACASGTDAIGLARNWLLDNRSDIVIAGGGDELSRIAYNGFSSLQLTSRKPCLPFDRDRDGLNLGEGAGVLILESEHHCHERGCSPLGWLQGYGAAADAYHPTAPHPEGRGLKSALDMALKQTGKKQKISYVNGHGTGTPSNDPAEMNGLKSLFADHKEITIVSTKGITGHTLGAAGAIEAIFTLLSLNKRFTPGTAGCRHPDSRLALKPLPQGESRKLASPLGITASLAFGGSNSALILEGAG